MRNNKVRKLVVAGMLSGICLLLSFTPLGYIPIGPLMLTILHLPVILGALVEGPVVGLVVGLVFGLSSVYRAWTTPTPVSFVFLDPLVSVLPRLLIGPLAYLAFRGFGKLAKGKRLAWLPAAGAAVTGSLVNTVGVLGAIYFLHGAQYVEAMGSLASMAAALIWGAALTNGLPEAAAAAIIVAPAERAISHVLGRRRANPPRER